MAVRNNSRTRAVLSSLDITKKPEILPQTVLPQTEQPMMQHETMQTDEAWAARYMEQTELFEDFVSRNFLNNLEDCEIYPLQQERTDTFIRWYMITKIVLEKDTFFPDKLSMLYMSLHNVAKNIILVVNKNEQGKINLYLGTRDFEGTLNVSGEILDAGLHGYLPGIRSEIYADGTPGNSYEKPFVSSVSGLASLRDDKREQFVQSIDKLINATYNISKFTAFFIADNVSDAEAQQMVAAFNDIHNNLSPLAETQLTISESETKGVSHTISENF